VLAVLLLRGPQTPGELKARSERMASIASLADVERVVAALADRGYVRRLHRRPGQKEDRFEQLLGGTGTSADGGEAIGAPASAPPVAPASPAPASPAPAPPAAPAASPAPAAPAPGSSADSDLEARVSALEADVAALRAELARLRESAPPDQVGSASPTT
jgi:hypothetical protein